MSEKHQSLLKNSEGKPRSQVGRVSGDALLSRQRFERLCQEVTDTLSRAGFTAETALATLPEVRKLLFARRYGTKPGKRSSRRD